MFKFNQLTVNDEMNTIQLFPKPKHVKHSDSYCELVIELPEEIDINCAVIDGLTEIYLPELVTQSFLLAVKIDSITLAYADQLGRLYGLRLLQQIKKQTNSMPCIEIEDSPDYCNRGIILDISRDKVPTLTHLFSMIDLWSKSRINKLQLYTEHTFAYSKHKQVWNNSGAYSGADIQEIDKYCKQQGIELVINQATFGHMERWLQHEDYKYLAEQTTGFTDQRGDFRPFSFGLNPIGENSAEFVSGLLDEMVPNYSSKTININFDETMDLGVDASSAECEQLGKGEVYVSYLKKLLTITQQKGLHTQIFSDMLFQYPEILNKLPKDLTLLNWGYEADHPFDKEHLQLQQTGLAFEVVVSTCCFASITGRWQNAKKQMLNGATSGLKFGATGYHISEWGDMGHAQQSVMPIAGYIYGAALAWGTEVNKDIDVQYWLAELYCAGDLQLAAITLGLQDIYLEAGIECPNCAFFGPLLFDQKSRRHIKHSKGLSEAGFKQCLEKLTVYLNEIAEIPDSYLQKQLFFSAEILKHACLLGKQLVKQDTLEAQSLDKKSRVILSLHLSPLIAEYQRLWKIDNREGGMSDSVERLQYLQRLYDNIPENINQR